MKCAFLDAKIAVPIETAKRILLKSVKGFEKVCFPLFEPYSMPFYSPACLCGRRGVVGRDWPRRACPPPDTGRGRGPSAASYREAMTQLTMGGAGVQGAEGDRTESLRSQLPSDEDRDDQK